MERIVGVWKTPDGWTVEIFQEGPKGPQWFRIIRHAEMINKHAAIATVRRILGDSYADLKLVDQPAA